MPASPKHVVRRENDFYETPYWATRILLDEINPLMSCKFLEPCAGNAAISKEILNSCVQPEILQVELSEYRRNELTKYGRTFIDDFLGNDINPFIESFKPTHIITNPPFSLAQEFIEKCMKIDGIETMFMLLPLSFMGSAERHKFWKQHEPSALFILSDRPSFTGTGSDSSVYAWYCWSNHNTYSGVKFLTNRYKTKYNRSKMEILYNEHGLKDFIHDKVAFLQDKIDFLNPNKINYMKLYKALVKDNSQWEDIYRNLM